MISSVALNGGTAGNIADLKMMDSIARSLGEAPDVDAVGFEPSLGLLYLYDGDPDAAVRWLGRGIARIRRAVAIGRRRGASRCW